MVFNTVIVMVELTSQWVTIILLEPVGKSVVVVICIYSVGKTVVIVVVSPETDWAVDFVDIKDVVVIVVRVNSVI